METTFDFSDKIVMITGAAGNLGKAVTFAFHSSGARVAVVDRHTESMAAELQDNNINVNCIMPGTIDTDRNRAEMPDADYSKWVTPSALANVIQFLASDAAKAINSAAIPVYGRS